MIGFIGKAIGEPLVQDTTLVVSPATLNFSGQSITLTPLEPATTRGPLLRTTAAGRREYWRGRSN